MGNSENSPLLFQRVTASQGMKKADFRVELRKIG